MGVLTNHIPLLTGLDTGVVLIRNESSSNWINVVVTGGFALVNNNKVTILVNEAELGSV
jgi:F-type H+-transporting ATPase subunit epsilon